jgi:hypothetical protein
MIRKNRNSHWRKHNMNVEQCEKVFDEVIHPCLIELAINDQLPLDMTQLHWGMFEEKAREFTNTQPEEKEVAGFTTEDIKDYFSNECDTEMTTKAVNEFIDWAECKMYDASLGCSWETLEQWLDIYKDKFPEEFE